MHDLIQYLLSNVYLDFQGDITLDAVRGFLREDDSPEARRLLGKLSVPKSVDEMLLILADCLRDCLRTGASRRRHGSRRTRTALHSRHNRAKGLPPAPPPRVPPSELRLAEFEDVLELVRCDREHRDPRPLEERHLGQIGVPLDRVERYRSANRFVRGDLDDTPLFPWGCPVGIGLLDDLGDADHLASVRVAEQTKISTPHRPEVVSRLAVSNPIPAGPSVPCELRPAEYSRFTLDQPMLGGNLRHKLTIAPNPTPRADWTSCHAWTSASDGRDDERRHAGDARSAHPPAVVRDSHGLCSASRGSTSSTVSSTVP